MLLHVELVADSADDLVHILRERTEDARKRVRSPLRRDERSPQTRAPRIGTFGRERGVLEHIQDGGDLSTSLCLIRERLDLLEPGILLWGPSLRARGPQRGDLRARAPGRSRRGSTARSTPLLVPLLATAPRAPRTSRPHVSAMSPNHVNGSCRCARSRHSARSIAAASWSSTLDASHVTAVTRERRPSGSTSGGLPLASLRERSISWIPSTTGDGATPARCGTRSSGDTFIAQRTSTASERTRAGCSCARSAARCGPKAARAPARVTCDAVSSARRSASSPFGSSSVRRGSTSSSWALDALVIRCGARRKLGLEMRMDVELVRDDVGDFVGLLGERAEDAPEGEIAPASREAPAWRVGRPLRLPGRRSRRLRDKRRSSASIGAHRDARRPAAPGPVLLPPTARLRRTR